LSFATLTAIRHASPREDWKQKHEAGILSMGAARRRPWGFC